MFRARRYREARSSRPQMGCRVPIKQKMISDEKPVPTGLLSIQGERDQIVRIGVLSEILHVDSTLHFGATPSQGC
jgi:hypothetical protein